MELLCHLNLETPQESTSHWGKPFSGPGKTELKHVRNQTSSNPPPRALTAGKQPQSFFSTLEKFLIFSLDSKPPPPSLLTAVWLFLLGWGARVVWIAVNSWNKWSAGVFKLCDKCDVFSWFRGDTHWRRPRFASIHFSPTRRERWSQMPAMQLGRKTLSRCLLQRGRHKDQ